MKLRELVGAGALALLTACGGGGGGNNNNATEFVATGWDVKRLWMASFVEEQRECRIRGGARTNEDVAEFLRRLTLSELFTSVVLNRTSEQGRDESATVSFELTCQVTY